jgi:hypothetical protein
MGLSRRGRESALRLDPSPLSEAPSMTIIPASMAAVAAASRYAHFSEQGRRDR